MGVNIFVEGWQEPVVIRIRLRRELHTFGDLQQSVSAFSMVDASLKKLWGVVWPDFEPRMQRDVRLIKFRLSSPLDVTIFADPAWIAVLITFLSGYPNIKSNVPEFLRDLSNLVDEIRGLTARKKELLVIAVKLTLERIAARGENHANAFAETCRAVRAALVGDSLEQPEIRVRTPKVKKGQR